MTFHAETGPLAYPVQYEQKEQTASSSEQKRQPPEEQRERGILDGASQEGLPIPVLVHSSPSRILEFFGIQCFTHPCLNK